MSVTEREMVLQARLYPLRTEARTPNISEWDCFADKTFNEVIQVNQGFPSGSVVKNLPAVQ